MEVNNSNDKNIILMSPIEIFSPKFPKFNNLSLYNLDKQSYINDASNDMTSDSNDDNTNDIINNTADVIDNRYSYGTLICNELSEYDNSTNDILNSLNMVKNMDNNPIVLITKSIKIDSTEEIDRVEKSLELIRDNAPYSKKIASMTIVSEILTTVGKILSWSADLSFTKFEWDYFLTICDLHVLKYLEHVNIVEYRSHKNTIYINNRLYNTSEEFLKSLFLDF